MSLTNKLLILSLLLLGLFLAACGQQKFQEESSVDQQIAEIKSRIAALSLISTTLDEAVNNEFEDCSMVNSVIKRMCEVAQAAVAQNNITVIGELSNMVDLLKGEVEAANDDLAAHQGRLAQLESDSATHAADIASIEADLSIMNASLLSLQGDIAAIDARLTNAEGDIDDIQDAISILEDSVADLVASFNSNLPDLLKLVAIGRENLSAGPLYESLLRKSDKKEISGYINVYSAPISLANNPVDPTNGSASVVITASAAHGLSVDDTVLLMDLDEGSGFTSGDTYGEFRVTAVSGLTFTVNLPRNATSGNVFGGTVGVMQKVVARGFGLVWKSDDASDVAVRQTSAGSQKYNFIIRRIASDSSNDTAEICYSKSNRSATFATINAAPEGGNASIACK